MYTVGTVSVTSVRLCAIIIDGRESVGVVVNRESKLLVELIMGQPSVAAESEV